MCLYPRRIQNKKYIASEKNQGIIPERPIIGYKDEILPNGKPYRSAIYDNRVNFVEVPCGQCIECRQNKAREWQVRLTEEIKDWQYKYFCTFTFAPKELEQLCLKTRQAEGNYIAGYAMRHFLERWRKEYKHSLKHWFIAELGHQGTERIHLHGLIFKNEPINKETLERYWKYGEIWVGDYCNTKTINYIVKYVTKIDTDHKGFIGQILASKGIGKNWIERHKDDITYTYRAGRTRTDYILNNGARVAMPKYYKNKLHSEEEREKIWRDFMDKDRISVLGNEIDRKRLSNIAESRIIQKAKENNSFYGYGSDDKSWRKRDFNVTERMLRSTQKKRGELKKTRLGGIYKEFWQKYYEKNEE